MFFTKTPISNFAPLVTDMHAHLLPGIDDGAKDMEEALKLIKGLKDLGFSKLIATPHIYPDYYPNTSKIIREKLEEVKLALSDAGIDMPLEAAAEYFLDDQFQALLDADDLLTLPGRYLLFEMSFFAPYPLVAEVVYNLRMKDYKPVLAHPERYNYYHSSKGFEALEVLWHAGVRMQVNLLSLEGAYGGSVKKQAVRLLEAEMVSFLGTDLHNMKHLEALKGMKDDVLKKYTFLNEGLW